MTRVYLADARREDRSALRQLLSNMKMDVVGAAADWMTTMAKAPADRLDMLLVDWDLLPSSPKAAIDELRKVCPATMAIVLISHLDATTQATRSIGADAFISRSDTSESVIEHLRTVVASAVFK